jgi:hypothetical protein
MTTVATLPIEGATYPYSIKLTETAKGIRIDVHIYAMEQEAVIKEAFETYLKAKEMAFDNKIPLAPLEDKK